MRHQTRLQLSFFTVILVFLGLLLAQMLFLGNLSSQIREVVDSQFTIQESVNRAREAVLTIRADIWDVLLVRSADRGRAIGRLDETAMDFYREERNLGLNLPGETVRLARLREGFKTYYLFASGILQMNDMGSFINSPDATGKYQENQDILIGELDAISLLTRQAVESATARLQGQLQTMQVFSSLVPGIVVVLVVIASFLLARRLTRPLETLSELAMRAAAGDYTVRAQTRGDLELAALGETFNHMLGKVESYSINLEDMVTERTHALAETNAELQASLETLKDTQGQLINAEKMAAIGILVAGVAHEVNTPLGNSITACSYLINRLHGLRKDFESGELRKSVMEEYLATSDELSRLMAVNLHKAGELIVSFKRVAVDQQSNERRRFDFRSYVGEIIISHQALLKSTPHQIINQVDEEIELDTHPGAIYQILSNLIVNSLRHGFHGQDAGTIMVSGHQTGGEVVLEYRDDGRGISGDLRKRVFEPFFTTMRNQGGSGLGLYIARTQAQSSLAGHLDLLDHTGVGVHFRLRFPRILFQAEPNKSN